MGKDTDSIDFYVDIVSAGPFNYTAANITGKLKNFGTEI